MSGRNRNRIARTLGLGVASLGLVAFVAAPGVAEETHTHAVRPPRVAAENPTHVHVHAVHKTPPSFAQQLQDHPAHKAHPGLQPGPQSPGIVLHIRAPHKHHSVAPVVVVQTPGQPRKQHVIVHSSKVVNKAPIVLTKRVPGGSGPTHPVKINAGTVKSTE